MRRTTAARIGLSSLLVAGSWAAFGLTPAANAAPAPAPVASSAVLAGMERDLGLTPAEAKARLAAEKEATAVERRAERAAGAAYGGSWFDAETNSLVVAVSDGAAADAVTGVGASVRLVEHSAKTLDAAKERIDTLDAPRGVAGWRVDPKANSVVVSVVEGRATEKPVRGFVERAGAIGPVEVETVAAAPETFAAGTVGGDPYYTGNVRCSIGFSVHGGFVTAGHCGGTGQSVSGWDGSGIGSFQGSSFPGDDMAYVSVGNGWWTEPVVLGWGTVSDQLVRGSAEAPVGASICRSGSTTHWHCGTVLAKNETVNYSQGAVHQMTKTSVCAEGGDSGGSFISGDQAQGVTSGGWGNCSGGGETWYQPVNEILGRYGLTLHTA
ncbi:MULTISPECIES: S1 family peptidase [Streptomyces]|uniref:Serine protease n=4 Tax=Streptomyces TaxID=1883 RepID=A0A8H9HM74_9ACTN|nr:MULTISPECIES: S1 family peptidase [Streptomyces]NEE24463.1 S1 family peptidase [Streptomyces sp. SID7982]NEE61647.1 S1 family peptidase [Streptomyces sp. SID8455]MBL3807927.1 S1 family peptidase [Streptomyces sp. BRB081]PJM82709.1 serine protease [Streptomyces sp. TSRI0384-2]QNE80089.1 S1 family peptidase [Streptomyces rutgersensis]